MLLDHSLVVVGRDRGQSLRNEVVESVARAHFNDVALMAEAVDVVDQQQFDALVLAARQAVGGSGILAGLRFHDWFVRKDSIQTSPRRSQRSRRCLFHFLERDFVWRETSGTGGAAVVVIAAVGFFL